MWNAIAGVLVIGLLGLHSVAPQATKTIYKTSSGLINFISVAPLETIKAGSKTTGYCQTE